jgi:hypothetical protein
MAAEIERIDKVPRLTPRDRQPIRATSATCWWWAAAGHAGGGVVGCQCRLARRGGAGDLRRTTNHQPHAATLCPCATSVHGLRRNKRVTTACLGQLAQAAEGCSVLAVGPGLAVGATNAISSSGHWDSPARQ